MKISSLQSELSKKKIDIALFLNINFELNPNIFYFSGYKGSGLLAIPKNKPAFLIVSEMETTKARKYSKVKVISKPKDKRLFEILKENIAKPKTLGLEGNIFSISALKELKKNFKKIEIQDITNSCLKIREIKTKNEIQIIKKGCNITDTILQDCINKITRFKTEAQVKAYLEYKTKLQSAELSFPTIVASGKNSSMAHHLTEEDKLKNGFCVIDYGIRYKGYCTDITRTIYIGKPNKKEVQAYNLVLNAQESAIKQVKPKAKCSEIYQIAQKELKSYAKYFNHGLGHGIGANIHELPNLFLESKDILKENMVFTIEPGTYPKNFGIRIKDDVLVTKKGYEVLTKTTKKLIIKRR